MMRQPTRGRRRPDGARERQPLRALTYPIPSKAAQAFEAHWQSRRAQNPSLLFDRYAPDWSEVEKVRGDGREVTIKQLGLEAICEAASRGDDGALAASRERWRKVAEAAYAQPFTLKTDWRLIAGLGRKGPLEAGFTFNRYGFPILPGSSVKGVARAWAFYHVAEMLGESELNHLERKKGETTLAALERLLSEADPRQYEECLAERYRQSRPEAAAIADDFRAIFGTTGAAGLAIFFDAIPTGRPKLQLDIMNPHFPDYYADKNGTVPPTDQQSPRPVYFLTVAEKSEFLFAVGWRRRPAGDAEAVRLQSRARGWLIHGLTELGAGAKTSAGYGYFQPPSTPRPDRAPIAPSSASSSALPIPPAEPLQARHGIIVEIRPDKRYGRVRDVETGREYRFPIEAIEGNTPGKKSSVTFELQSDQVVKVRKG